MLMETDYIATLQHIERASGATALLGGGGTAYVSDASAADSNPANLSNNNSFSVTGQMIWQPTDIKASEIAVIDGALSEVTAVLKARQTSSSMKAQHRRFTLAVAERLGNSSPLSVGVGVDYEQLIRKEDYFSQAKNPKKKDNYRLRFGLSYSLGNDIVLSLTSKGYLDKFLPKEHSVGAAYRFASDAFIALADGVFQGEKYHRTHLGLVVMPQPYLDLSVSYGYLASSGIGFWSWGASLKSEHARIFYGVKWPENGSKKPNQHGGISLALQLK